MSQPTAPVEPMRGDEFRLGVLVCGGCSAVHRDCVLSHGQVAHCRRCAQVLGRGPVASVEAQLAFALAALAVFVIAQLSPIVVLELGTVRTEATLLDAVRQSWLTSPPVALLAFVTAFACPLAVVVLRLHLLLAIADDARGAGFAAATRMLHWATRWSMVEVFTLAALIATSRSATVARGSVAIGLAAFGVLTVLLTAHQGVVPWRRSPRRAPDPQGLQRCAALLVAAAVLYVPSNLLPVMFTRTPAGEASHTLFGGVIDLWRTGAWELALIVFVASIVVPLTKMMALALLLFTAQRRSRWRQRERARLYRLIDAIGHWSMLDVYVVVLLAGMVAFGPLAGVAPATGLAAFGAVVVLTMLAVDSFDPRLIWPPEHDG